MLYKFKAERNFLFVDDKTLKTVAFVRKIDEKAVERENFFGQWSAQMST